jgi:hypothetical protein
MGGAAAVGGGTRVAPQAMPSKALAMVHRRANAARMSNDRRPLDAIPDGF